MQQPTVLQTTRAPSLGRCERLDLVLDLDDLVVGRPDPRHMRENVLDLFLVPSAATNGTFYSRRNSMISRAEKPLAP